MSKFRKTLDEIEVDDDLKYRARRRIYNNRTEAGRRNAGKPRRRLAITLISFALVVALAFPAYLVAVLLYDSSYDFSRAIPVQTEKRLSSLLQREKEVRLRVTIDDSFNQSKSNEILQNDSASSSSQSSTTNVQVDGMDEGDCVKNDGNYIYRLSDSGFSIIKADKGKIEKVCEILLGNFSAHEMYVYGSLLVILGDVSVASKENERNYASKVEIRIYDLSDISNPVLVRYYSIEGFHQTSRLSEKNGLLYFVANYDTDYSDAVDTSAARPYYADCENGAAKSLHVRDMYYFKNTPVYSYLILGALDLNDTEKEVVTKAYLNCGTTTYVSGEYLYSVAVQNDVYVPSADLTRGSNQNKSFIVKYSLHDLTFLSSNSFIGTIKDRYCLSEYNGYLRVAAGYLNVNTWQNASVVFVFDENMNEISSIDNIAPGESIDSAAFSGDKGYISTSLRLIDPLFIIDFSEPHKPKISEGLKEDGINNYLKAIPDTDYVLGFGTDSATDFSFNGTKTGLKIQMYDMSGEDAVSVAKHSITGDMSSAEALTNPKAILYKYNKETKKGFVAFAAEQSERLTTSYSMKVSYKKVWFSFLPHNRTVKCQGLFFYEFDTSEGTLDFLGILSNFDTSENVGDVINTGDFDWKSYNEMTSKFITRGIIIGDYVYTVSPSIVTSYKLSDLSKTNEFQG